MDIDVERETALKEGAAVADVQARVKEVLLAH